MNIVKTDFGFHIDIDHVYAVSNLKQFYHGSGMPRLGFEIEIILTDKPKIIEIPPIDYCDQPTDEYVYQNRKDAGGLLWWKAGDLLAQAWFHGRRIDKVADRDFNQTYVDVAFEDIDYVKRATGLYNKFMSTWKTAKECKS